MKHQPLDSSTWEYCRWNKLLVYYVLPVKNDLHILYKCCPAFVGLDIISNFQLFWQFHIKFGLLSEMIISWTLSLMWLSHSSCVSTGSIICWMTEWIFRLLLMMQHLPPEILTFSAIASLVWQWSQHRTSSISHIILDPRCCSLLCSLSSSDSDILLPSSIWVYACV